MSTERPALTEADRDARWTALSAFTDRWSEHRTIQEAAISEEEFWARIDDVYATRSARAVAAALQEAADGIEADAPKASNLSTAVARMSRLRAVETLRKRAPQHLAAAASR